MADDTAFQSPSPLAGEGLGRGVTQLEQGQFVKSLRQNMTDAEHLLWLHLRAHRLDGQKFRRQQSIGPYIVDFVHFGARLIVEADGGQHNDNAYDRERDEWLITQGFKVMRFWNADVLHETHAVLTTIWSALEIPLSPSPSPARGEGSKRLYQLQDSP